MRVVPAHSVEFLGPVRELFVEYEQAIDVDLCFQNFEQELAGLPGKYTPPSGRLLLALAPTGPAGCVALRQLDDGIGEMKRLYVRPAFRGQGVGRLLATAVLAAAKEIGYTAVRLDTLAGMKEALSLYGSLGFRITAPYCHNPCPDAVFLELKIAPEPGRS